MTLRRVVIFGPLLAAIIFGGTLVDGDHAGAAPSPTIPGSGSRPPIASQVMDALSFYLADPVATPSPIEPTPPAYGDLSRVRKAIVLRDLTGAPVAGVEVHIAPATSDMGGPLDSSAFGEKSGTTDASGRVEFPGLDRYIWMVSFEGIWQGKSLQPVSEQGRAPWGRTRNGGGFTIVQEAQEDGPVPTPEVIDGVIQPMVQTTLFVLLDGGGHLIPTIDLSNVDVLEAPYPLTSITPISSDTITVPASTPENTYQTATPDPRASQDATSAPVAGGTGEQPSSGDGLWSLALLVTSLVSASLILVALSVSQSRSGIERKRGLSELDNRLSGRSSSRSEGRAKSNTRTTPGL